ncbi:hypothetical protein Q3G72_029528 [Acer saccharum]|nr:hypothetical protein Q3G72_029528 [Acer saccharum]
MYVDPEITPTNQETTQWYYDGLQNVDDLYPAPGSLDNMPDDQHPDPSSSTFQSRYDKGGLDHAAPRSQHADTVREDKLEIVLYELRDSNRRREEEHAELMRIFRSYRHNDDQSHTLLGHSLSMSQYARSYHPLDPLVGLQNSPNVQDPPLMAQQTSRVMFISINYV